MLKFSHTTLIILAGLLWMVIGTFLLTLGVNFIMKAIETPVGHYPLMNSLAPYLGGKLSVGLLLIVAALFVGFFKGKYALGRSAVRVTHRIKSFPNPTSLHNIFSAGYYILIGSMVLLGIGIKYLGLAEDVRGFIDAAIGAALVHGGSIYFRLAAEHKKAESN